MTVIAAARTSKGITLAADSQTSSGGSKHYKAGSKLFVSGGYAFGAAGCLRTIQVIKTYTHWPVFHPEEMSWEHHLISLVVPAIRAGAKGHGVLVNVNGEEYLEASLIIATGSYLAEVSGNGCVFEDDSDRSCIGSGQNEAYGYLGNTGPWTEKQVIAAANAATITDSGCSGKIDYVSTKDLVIK